MDFHAPTCATVWTSPIDERDMADDRNACEVRIGSPVSFSIALSLAFQSFTDIMFFVKHLPYWLYVVKM